MTRLTDELVHRMAAALTGGPQALDGLADARPRDELDALSTLLEIQALHLAPVSTLQGRVRFQHHPALAALKLRLEQELVERLDRLDPSASSLPSAVQDAAATVEAVRRLATANLVPPVYDWIAEHATYADVVTFLAIEGGPDGGFDDLVAIAQVGLDGPAKLTLAVNYWDEMGRGHASDVHTTLHRRLAAALDLGAVPASELSIRALCRSALNGMLATHRALQPEMVGALGILEMQAGPRCRRVLSALERVGAPAGAVPFYAEHATADPRHGKAWLDSAIAPLAETHPEWRAGMVRGARWRCAVNDSLFSELFDRFAGSEQLTAA